MVSTMRDAARKGFAVALSLLLALLLMPAVPVAAGAAGQAVAAEGDAYQTQAYYNNLPSAEEQGDPAFNKLTEAYDLEAVQKAIEDVAVADEVPAADDQAVIDAVEAAEPADAVASDSLEVTAVELTGIENVASSDTAVATVAKTADDAAWEFKLLAPGTTKVSFGTAWEVSYSYMADGADPSAAPVTGDVTLAVDAGYSHSYDLTVSNLYTLPQAQIIDSMFYGATSEFAAPVNNETSEVAVLVDGAGAEVASVASDEGRFEVTVEGGQAVVTAMAAASQGDTATLTWKYDNGMTQTQSVTVTSLLAKQIELDDITLPYRLADEQLPYVKEQIAAQVAGQVASADAENVEANVDAVAMPGDYPATDAGGSFSLDVSGIALTGSAAGNYKLATNSITVTVEPVEAVDASSVTLSANGAAVSDPANTWVNGDVTATLDGYTLSKTLDGNYTDSVEMEKAEGVYTNQVLYALSEADGTVSRIDGISYKLDKTAPVVRSFSVSDPVVRHDGILFFGSDEEVCDVAIAVSDQPSDNMVGATADTRAEVSGLAQDGASVSYRDSHAGSDVSLDAAAAGWSFNADAGTFSFEIDGDQDVKTDSFAVTAKDVAGNQMEADTRDALQIPSDVLELVADSVAPQVSVSYDNNVSYNGSYYNAARTATFTITEANFRFLQQYDPSQAIVTISQDGEARSFYPGSFSNVGGDVWQATYTFNADADYTVSMRATDLIGRSSSTVSDAFTIDKTSPEISVTFDNNNVVNGNYYNAPRTATITVVEHNFSANLMSIEPSANAGNGDEVGQPEVSGWSSDGDVHTATVTFPGQGVYALTVTGADLASNAVTSYSCPEFVIDTLGPEIQISLENLHAYADAAPLDVTVTDTNLDSSTEASVTKVGYPYGTDQIDVNPYAAASTSSATTEYQLTVSDPANVVESDGIYTVMVNARDMAGNAETQALSWSVNRFGSTYVIQDEGTLDMMDAQYVNNEKLADVVVTEVNPSGHSSDEAAGVELSKDTTSSTLEADDDYAVDEDSSQWHQYTYTVYQDNFASDGAYRVLFHSVDAAGHSAENTMDGKGVDYTGTAEVGFAVDNTRPIVSFVDAESGTHEGTEYTFQVNATDNLKLDYADVYVDGQKYGDSLEGEGVHEVTLPEKAGAYSVELVAYDAAGNESEHVTLEGITVTTNPLVLWMSNTPLFVGSIVAALVVVGLIVFAALRAKRKKQEN